MSLLDYCSRYFTDRLPVKDRIVFKISTSFVFSFFVFLPFLFYILYFRSPATIRHRISVFVYTPSRTLRSSSAEKLSCAR